MITDEGSIPEMRIWSILEIKSDLKWCILLSSRLYLYLLYLSKVLTERFSILNKNTNQGIYKVPYFNIGFS